MRKLHVRLFWFKILHNVHQSIQCQLKVIFIRPGKLNHSYLIAIDKYYKTTIFLKITQQSLLNKIMKIHNTDANSEIGEKNRFGEECSLIHGTKVGKLRSKGTAQSDAYTLSEDVSEFTRTTRGSSHASATSTLAGVHKRVCVVPASMCEFMYYMPTKQTPGSYVIRSKQREYTTGMCFSVLYTMFGICIARVGGRLLDVLLVRCCGVIGCHQNVGQ